MGAFQSFPDEAGASHTAMIQASIRYLGTLEREPSVRTNDELGYHFVTDLAMKFCMSRFTKPIGCYVSESRWPGGFGYSMARSRIGDTQFQSFEGAQVVNLGAGFCTRFIRYQEQVRDKGFKIFELDLPATQAKKKRIAANIDPGAMELVKFISVDFNKQSLEEMLSTSTGYDPKAKTIFFWDGVSTYLTEEAVGAVFKYVRENSAPGSLILFDYLYADYLTDQTKYYGGSTVYDYLIKKGEPLTYGIPDGGIKEWLNERGFEQVEHWTGEQLESQFLTTPNGTVVHKADGPFAICVAKVL